MLGSITKSLDCINLLICNKLPIVFHIAYAVWICAGQIHFIDWIKSEFIQFNNVNWIEFMASKLHVKLIELNWIKKVSELYLRFENILNQGEMANWIEFNYKIVNELNWITIFVVA